MVIELLYTHKYTKISEKQTAMIPLNNCNIIATYFSLDFEPEFLFTPNPETEGKKKSKMMTYNGW